jgi:hypothetical protein
LFFFDESRFGTHSKIAHGWFRKGSRTPVNVKLGFENFYVYTAVNPFEGEDFTMIIPNVNSDCLNAYLDEFSKYLGDREVFFVLDGAAWHKAGKLKKQHNIEFIYLPPYSPELNPVERFWEHLKGNTIKNKVFDSLACIETEISIFLNGITKDATASICSVSYL